MKILHIVEDFSLHSGGLRTVINDLNKYLNQNFSSHILSSNSEKEDNIFTVKTQKPWLYSKLWEIKLTELYKKHNYNIFHIHGVWMYPQYKSAKFCIENNIPFIISTHGMYEPWLWKQGYFKKKIYYNYLVKNIFKKAKYIHAITPQEKVNLGEIFKFNQIVEIPNLISEKSILINKPRDAKEKYMLYLGRLDKKKGIDILIDSLGKINDTKIILKIAGNYNEYKAELDLKIKNNKLSDRVVFLGLVSGEQKELLIKNAFVLVAPSFSEVIGMVNLEGAILKTPVITTHQTGLNPLWDANGGKLINPNITELTKTLNEVLSWSDEERNKNGEKLYDFVIKNYSWSHRFKDWINLYELCLKGKDD
ncbi:MAG: glycosyltransferase [Polaribacter sp.]